MTAMTQMVIKNAIEDWKLHLVASVEGTIWYIFAIYYVFFKFASKLVMFLANLNMSLCFKFIVVGKKVVFISFLSSSSCLYMNWHGLILVVYGNIQ